jgi:hypothetical protein
VTFSLVVFLYIVLSFYMFVAPSTPALGLQYARSSERLGNGFPGSKEFSKIEFRNHPTPHAGITALLEKPGIITIKI